MSNSNQNETMGGGRYVCKLTTTFGPLRPGCNRTDEWTTEIKVEPGCPVKEALRYVTIGLARDQGVPFERINVINYTFLKVG